MRSCPRISVNKLAEYLSAPPARRKRIIHDQKEPKTFVVARYTEAERAITEAICGRSLRPVEHALKALEGQVARSDFAAETAQLCWDALSSFADLWEEGLLDIDGLELRPGDNNAPKLEVGGVAISVRPEIFTAGVERGETTVGAIKFCLSKTNPLDAASGANAATVVRHFVETHRSEGRVDSASIIVVDVFSRQVFTAPKSYKRRLADVAAACEEIALRWPTA
jgi:hypothetical protein